MKKAVTVCLEPLNIISIPKKKKKKNLYLRVLGRLRICVRVITCLPELFHCVRQLVMRLCLKLAFQLPVQRGHRRWNILYEDTMSILVRPHLTPPHLQRHHLPGMTNNGWGHVKWFPIQLPLEVAIDCSHKVWCILTRSLNRRVSKRLVFLIRCSQVEQVIFSVCDQLYRAAKCFFINLRLCKSKWKHWTNLNTVSCLNDLMAFFLFLSGWQYVATGIQHNWTKHLHGGPQGETVYVCLTWGIGGEGWSLQDFF